MTLLLLEGRNDTYVSTLPKIEKFIDSFGSLSRWTVYSGVATTPNGVVLLDASASPYNTLVNANGRFNMRGSSIFYNVPNRPSLPANTYLLVAVNLANMPASFIYCGVVYTGTTMFARTRIAGGVYTDSAPVAAADWVRVRESNGYFYYDYSADGTNWTQFASCGHPWTPDLLDYSIPLVWLQSASGVPPAGYVDHVNYVPPVVGGGGAMSYLGKYDAGFNATTSPRTVSVTAAAGDLLVALSMDEEDAEVFATPTGGAVTWTQQQQLGTASRCRAGLWSAPVAAGATWTYSQAVTGSVGGTWGTAVARFANGVPGASALTTGSGSTPPALALSTTAANSGILVIMADWSGVAGTSRVWNAVNGYTPSAGNGGEIVYTNSSGNYTAYAAWYPDAGPVGAKNLGFTTNFAGGHTIAAIEVKKSVGSPFDLRLAGIF